MRKLGLGSNSKLGVLLLLSSAAWSAAVGDHPEEFLVKENFLLSVNGLRQHRLKMIEQRAAMATVPRFESPMPQTAVTFHFRVDAESSVELRRLRFRLDESDWWELNLLSAESKWHSFLVEKAVVGERNLLLNVEGRWKKDLDPVLLGASFLESEGFVAVKISEQLPDVAINIEATKVGWFSPTLKLKLRNLEGEKP